MVLGRLFRSLVYKGNHVWDGFSGVIATHCLLTGEIYDLPGLGNDSEAIGHGPWVLGVPHFPPIEPADANVTS